MRKWTVPVAAAVALFAMNALIAHKESIKSGGTRMLLRLTPADPRSLMQGDYMDLRYQLARDLDGSGLPRRGRLVVRLDAQGVAASPRLHQGERLAPGEHLLRFRRRDDVRIGAETWFFQEGKAELYEKAVYGELRVSRGGECVLVGLCDEVFRPLGR